MVKEIVSSATKRIIDQPNSALLKLPSTIASPREPSPFRFDPGTKPRTVHLTGLCNTDMLAYMERQRKRQHELLNALSRDAIENGLYDIDSAAALEALQQVRKG